MAHTGNIKKILTLMIAVVFVFVTAFSVSTAPAYAASRKPAQVKGLKAAAVSSSSIRITWKKAKRAKKYQVYRATKKKGKYKKIATVKKRSYVNKKLSAGKRYYYKVRAVNGKKKGKFSIVKSAKTPAQSVVITPTEQTEKKVSFNCTVNGQYFDTSTRHFIINKTGFNAGKAILTADISPEDLYKKLVMAGGISWSSSKDKELKDGELISTSNAENPNFSHLEVTVSWGGKTYPLSDVLTLTKGGATPPDIDMVFSGNPQAAEKTPSGCIACLDSCYIGIISNMKYGLCVIDKHQPAVYARPGKLPQDGETVTVNITVKK